MKSRSFERFGLAVLSLSLAAPLLRAADYFVSPAGNDANTGLSPAAPWKTIAKVNARVFAAGDRVLFEGGQTFAGSLFFDAADAGSASQPITVSSYGSGRATIGSAGSDGLYAYNTAGLLVSNLAFAGPGAASSTKSGIIFYTDLAGNLRLPYVHIDGVDVSGYRNGISIGGWNGTAGYDDVRVTNSSAHDNQRVGMSTYAQSRYGITNVYVGHCSFSRNLGDPAMTTNSGSGIVLGEVNHAVIERSAAWGNGASCTANEGPVGIWCYDSNDVTIQHNESYDNRTGGPADGGGFDLDGGTTNSVLQYNYSHGNDGAGYGLYQYSGAAPWSGNVVRYNVSENDGRRNGYGAIQIWNGGSGIGNSEVHNNTIFVSPSATGTSKAINFFTGSTNFHFRDNVIVSSGGLLLLDVPSGQSGILFQGNDYWSSGAGFGIRWNGTTYSSLAAWIAATGQEKNGSTVVGRNVDPQLASPGAGGTVGNPDNLASLAAYRLQPGSPMVDTALDLAALFGVNPGAADFYGSAIPQGSGYDAGAHELVASGPNQPPVVSAAAAAPNPVTGRTASMSAAATDDGGEATLSYAWAVVTAPSGGGATFGPNGSNAAKSSTATFSRPGSYVLRVTATDAGALSASRDVGLTVIATLTTTAVSPAAATVVSGGSQQYSASAADQFGTVLAPPPAFTWSITGGSNSISASGLAHAGTKSGTFTVTASAGGKSGGASLTVARKRGR